MRKFSLVLIVMALLSVGSVSANNPEVEKTTKRLASKVAELLQKSPFERDFVGHTADIRFMINREREIVVLTIDTKDSNLEYILKRKLNYKKVNVQVGEEGKTYIVPIRVEG